MTYDCPYGRRNGFDAGHGAGYFHLFTNLANLQRKVDGKSLLGRQINTRLLNLFETGRDNVDARSYQLAAAGSYTDLLNR